jgi:hypothetical protein
MMDAILSSARMIYTMIRSELGEETIVGADDFLPVSQQKFYFSN